MGADTCHTKTGRGVGWGAAHQQCLARSGKSDLRLQIQIRECKYKSDRVQSRRAGRSTDEGRKGVQEGLLPHTTPPPPFSEGA
jgi:hypothetical protein